MKKNGFTLIEILGVIAILGILGVIVVPTITSVMNQNQQTIDENQKKLIISAAKSYATENAFNHKEEITINELQELGYLEKTEIKNNKTDEDYKCSVVKITKNNNKYEYTFEYKKC